GRPGAVRGAGLSEARVTAGLASWRAARTAPRDATGIAHPSARVAFLGREHAVGRHREALGDVLGQRRELGELAETAVIREALRFLVEGQRALEQHLGHELL